MDYPQFNQDTYKFILESTEEDINNLGQEQFQNNINQFIGFAQINGFRLNIDQTNNIIIQGER